MTMAPVNAKIVTVVTGAAARPRVVEALEAMGARGFTVSRVEGHGAHGDRKTGFFDDENVAFSVVVPEPLALRILEWVETDLAPREPSIAYAADVLAVPAGHFS